MVGWSIGWLVGWLANWLVNWLAGWLVGFAAVCSGWFTMVYGRLVDFRFVGWLLVDSRFVGVRFVGWLMVDCRLVGSTNKPGNQPTSTTVALNEPTGALNLYAS